MDLRILGPLESKRKPAMTAPIPRSPATLMCGPRFQAAGRTLDLLMCGAHRSLPSGNRSDPIIGAVRFRSVSIQTTPVKPR
jgi:hypothetical protein